MSSTPFGHTKSSLPKVPLCENQHAMMHEMLYVVAILAPYAVFAVAVERRNYGLSSISPSSQRSSVYPASPCSASTWPTGTSAEKPTLETSSASTSSRWPISGSLGWNASSSHWSKSGPSSKENSSSQSSSHALSYPSSHLSTSGSSGYNYSSSHSSSNWPPPGPSGYNHTSTHSSAPSSFPSLPPSSALPSSHSQASGTSGNNDSSSHRPVSESSGDSRSSTHWPVLSGKNNSTFESIRPDFPNPWVYKGCYSDSVSSRTLNLAFKFSDEMTPSLCIKFCGNKGYTYAGTE
jgi:hypothetical protein